MSSSTSGSAQCSSDSTTTSEPLPGHAVDEGVHGAPGLLARPRRVDALQRVLVAHEVEQAVDEHAAVGRRGVDADGVADRALALAPGRRRRCRRARSRTPGAGPRRSATTRWPRRTGRSDPRARRRRTRLRRDRRDLLGQPALADAGLADEQHELGPAAGDRGRRGRGAAARPRGRGRPAASACGGAGGPAGRGPRSAAHASTGSSRPRACTEPSDSYCITSRVSTHVSWPDDDLSGLGQRLQPAGHVHHVAHGRVVAAGPQRADQHLAGVDADAQLHVDADLGGDGRRASAASAARPARPARRRPRGRPVRRRGRRWRRRRSCRPGRRRR